MNYKLLCGVALSCTALFSTPKPISLLVVDTQGKDAYYYRNLIMLATSAGFTVDYKNIYDLLENSDVSQYQALFFMMSPQMLTIQPTSSFFNALLCVLPRLHSSTIPEYCWNILYSFAQQSNKAIGIILPGHMRYSPKLQKQAYKAVQKLGTLKHRASPTKRLVRQFVTYITSPDASKGSLFGTSLINSGNPTFPTITDRKGKDITKIINPDTNEITAILTPIGRERYDERIQRAFPVGLLIKDAPKNNLYLISKTSEFDFADLFEHFFKNPFSIEDRNELLNAAQETLLSWHDTYSTNQITIPAQRPKLPHQFSRSYLQKEKERIALQRKDHINKALYGWTLDEGISCAWLDPYDFYAYEDAKQKLKKKVTTTNDLDEATIKNKVETLALSRGIKLIYHAGFNLLWFEFVPEWYLSPHGLRKEQREEYVQRITRLGTQLRSFFAAHNRPLPKIFVGLNLTSNFRTYPVQNPVQDLYGNTYSKIPCPFDMSHFWKPEVLFIFDEFIEIFQEALPIDGIFFDFEMYHAPEQGGMYSDLMDFSDMAWRTYCTQCKDTHALQLKTVKERVTHLQKEKLFRHYFTALEQASRALGNKIKQHMRTKKPNLMFGAYAPTLPYSWFYRGIMAGLSSPSEPLLLATFNTDYASHHQWLTKHHIHLLHGSAVMLSKLKQRNDFMIIPSLLTHHDFVWYNRPSRMIYEYTQEELDTIWWGIEATPLDTTKTMRYTASAKLLHLS